MDKNAAYPKDIITFALWRTTGVWRQMNQVLRERVRYSSWTTTDSSAHEISILQCNRHPVKLLQNIRDHLN